MHKKMEKSKKNTRLKIFANDDPKLSLEYQNFADKTHFIGSKYLATEGPFLHSLESAPIKPEKKPQQKNISAAFTGIWSSPANINIYELLLWREKIIPNSLITSKQSPLYKHIVELRHQAMNVIESKHKTIINDYLQTLCSDSNKRRKIFCGNDLLMSFAKFAHKNKIHNQDPKNQNETAVQKLTRIYLLNKMILGVTATTNDCPYKTQEF